MSIINITPEELAAYFDHTQLKAFAARKDFEIVCEESKKYGFKMVAINSVPVKLCKELLKGTRVHVGAAIGFPLGQTGIEVKRFETIEAIDNGADEIDYVINQSQLKEKNYDYVQQEMHEIVSYCRSHNVISKVIFENCYLSRQEKEVLCSIAREIKPDFVKTSTGFGTGGATLEDVKLMKKLVGDTIQVKAAGGIRNLEDAVKMIEAGATRIGSTVSVHIMEEFYSI